MKTLLIGSILAGIVLFNFFLSTSFWPEEWKFFGGYLLIAVAYALGCWVGRNCK